MTRSLVKECRGGGSLEKRVDCALEIREIFIKNEDPLTRRQSISSKGEERSSQKEQQVLRHGSDPVQKVCSFVLTRTQLERRPLVFPVKDL